MKDYTEEKPKCGICHWFDIRDLNFGYCMNMTPLADQARPVTAHSARCSKFKRREISPDFVEQNNMALTALCANCEYSACITDTGGHPFEMICTSKDFDGRENGPITWDFSCDYFEPKIIGGV